jgi:hypothetical protein
MLHPMLATVLQIRAALQLHASLSTQKWHAFVFPPWFEHASPPQPAYRLSTAGSAVLPPPPVRQRWPGRVQVHATEGARLCDGLVRGVPQEGLNPATAPSTRARARVCV